MADGQSTHVQLPDGTFVEIPQDATPEQLSAFKSKLAQKFPQVAGDKTEAAQVAARPNTTQQAIDFKKAPLGEPLAPNVSMFSPEASTRIKATNDALREAPGMVRDIRLLAASPFIAPATIAAPLATGTGIGGSILGSYGGNKLARSGAAALGASPETQDLAGEAGENLGGLAGGLFGAKVGSGVSNVARTALFDANNKFSPLRPAEVAARALLKQPATTPAQEMSNSVSKSVQRAVALRQAKIDAGLVSPSSAPVGTAAQETGITPSITKIPIRSQSPADLAMRAEQIPGPDTAGKGNLLTPLAKTGNVNSALEMNARGRPVLFVGSTEEANPPKFKMTFGGGEPEPLVGNPTPFANNGSGESAASLESINRTAAEKLGGVKYFLEDKGGQRIPLSSTDANSGMKLGPGKRIIRVDKNGESVYR